MASRSARSSRRRSSTTSSRAPCRSAPGPPSASTPSTSASPRARPRASTSRTSTASRRIWKVLEGNKDYEEKGRSAVRILNETTGVVYARLPGEAWDLGAGYAVGRLAVRGRRAARLPDEGRQRGQGHGHQVAELLHRARGGGAGAALGLFLSFMEHTAPLRMFAAQTIELAKGKIDVLAPSKFSGAYKKIAADINDGMEKIAEKGGVPRKAANLEKVLGPMPQQPAMSAFALPGEGAPPASSQVIAPASSSGPKGLPKAPPRNTPVGEPPTPIEPVAEAPAAPAAPSAKPKPPPPKRPGAPAPVAASQEVSVAEASTIQSVAALTGDEPFDEMADWRRVYEEFLAMKQQCGEPAGNLTFEKFKDAPAQQGRARRTPQLHAGEVYGLRERGQGRAQGVTGEVMVRIGRQMRKLAIWPSRCSACRSRRRRRSHRTASNPRTTAHTRSAAVAPGWPARTIRWRSTSTPRAWCSRRQRPRGRSSPVPEPLFHTPGAGHRRGLADLRPIRLPGVARHDYPGPGSDPEGDAKGSLARRSAR